MKPALIGLGFGLVLAFASSRVMRTLLYGIGPGDPAAFALVPVLLILVALMACWFPAMRAASINPATVLRSQ
jgi:ABC-type lipoprotein release transport system permease subunit